MLKLTYLLHYEQDMIFDKSDIEEMENLKKLFEELMKDLGMLTNFVGHEVLRFKIGVFIY